MRTERHSGRMPGLRRSMPSAAERSGASLVTMEDITVEQIEKQIQRTASCASVTLPSGQLRPLLNLAMRKAIKDSGTIARLQRAARGVEVRLTGDEIRMVLDFALQTKRAETPRGPNLRVAPPSPKKD